MVVQGRGFKPFPEGTVGARKQSYTLDASHTDFDTQNDVIEMVPVYAGETVIGVILHSTDVDTNVSPAIVMDVGDGSDVDGYIDGATVGQTGGGTVMSAPAVGYGPKTYTADDTIDIRLDVAAATAATGTVTLTVLVV
jgi:hypothetical protein